MCGIRAAADAEFDAAAAQYVERRELFGDAQRLREWQLHDRSSESQALGALCDRSQQQRWTAERRHLEVEVVLHRPGGFEAECFAKDALIDGFAVELSRRLIFRAAEKEVQSEFHDESLEQSTGQPFRAA